MKNGIRRAGTRDWPRVRELLVLAELPVNDLAAERMGDFLVWVGGDGSPGAAIGLERYGEVALLRSLVVAQASRGAGLGSRLVAELEDVARTDGLHELWLLTNDADGFFAKLGYRVVNRADAPKAVQGSPEFSSICPASAILMMKKLA
ncbi:MAG: arsenic resistance N-acetyltransferase ArsN2 [Gammaproteobacteria bacterium]|nr:arsenic resistance N-acetyltransferase ArsN2 [Gammaproteobacteria bacterium]MDH4254389.1 arsenic resistance N-acetyltransferase ArsN2 [Gammaproteobacteria bacterium]MDH5309322.1 arsenic resistance N-acetyltransferase ArsN2 [Gammaproteobacteria bacterium]